MSTPIYRVGYNFEKVIICNGGVYNNIPRAAARVETPRDFCSAA